MSSEGANQRSIWLKLGLISRLFRVNTGRAWLSGAGPARRMANGSVMVPAARPVALGFADTAGKPVRGTSDLCGWTTVKITPEMVGRDVAVFTAIETKRTKGGKASEHQISFVEQVNKAGGIAGIASSPDEAINIIEQWSYRLL